MQTVTSKPSKKDAKAEADAAFAQDVGEARKLDDADLKGTKPQGRKDSDGQAMVITLDKLTPKVITHLVELRHHLDAVSGDFNDAIKAKAEEAGILAATLRKFIDAKAGEKFSEKKEKVLQLSLVFEKLGA